MATAEFVETLSDTDLAKALVTAPAMSHGCVAIHPLLSSDPPASLMQTLITRCGPKFLSRRANCGSYPIHYAAINCNAATVAVIGEERSDNDSTACGEERSDKRHQRALRVLTRFVQSRPLRTSSTGKTATVIPPSASQDSGEGTTTLSRRWRCRRKRLRRRKRKRETSTKTKNKRREE